MPPFIWTGRDDQEDGPTARRVYHCHAQSGRHAVIGFASDEGVSRNQGRIGAAEGPNAIRSALSNLPVPADFPSFTDKGDISVIDGDMEDAQQRLGQTISAALSSHDRVLVLGGGHETAFGSYLGLRASHPTDRIGIVNFDAHLDIRNIGANGPSSGTPFNQIRAREGAIFDYLCIGVAEEANTQALFERAEDWGVRMVSDHAVSADMTIALAEIDALIDRNDVLYLTIDLDVLPHFQAPGVSAPAVRGVSFQILEKLVGHCLDQVHRQDCTLPVCDIVELSPPHDIQGMTAKTAGLLARQLLLR